MEPDVMDAALIGAAQKVEHYEIAGYATARDECFFLANYLPKLLNIFSSMTP